jgi:hypothetical protein
MNPFKRLAHILASYSLPFLMTVTAAVAIVATLTYNLNSQPAKFSQGEATNRQQTTTIRAILRDPVNLPHKVLDYGVQKTSRHGTIAMRSVSVAYAILILAAFFFLIESWHTTRIAIIATLLFASSSWFLHTARLATPDILLAILPAILFSAAWLREKKLTRLSVVLLIIAGAGLLYIPGFVWFVIAGVGWQGKEIVRGLKKLPYGIVVPCVLFTLLLLGPLVYAAILDPSILKTIAGLPQSIPAPKDLLNNLASIPKQLFWRGPGDAAHWLSGTPLLDIFSIGMLALGSYAYIFRLRLDRTKLLIGFAILSFLLVSLGGGVSITVLLPLVYIIIAAGITWLLQQWFTVFPRNPFARAIAVVLLCVAVAFSTSYNLKHYFVAWQKAPETRSTFTVAP